MGVGDFGGQFKEDPQSDADALGGGGGGSTPIYDENGNIIGYKKGGGSSGGGGLPFFKTFFKKHSDKIVPPLIGIGANQLVGAGGRPSFGAGGSGDTEALEVWIGNMLRQAGEETAPLAFGNLRDILASNGRSSPGALNRDLRSIDRDTEAAIQGQRGSAAAGNLQNSGVVGRGGAVEAAIGNAGLDRRAAARINETELAERRRREDLALFRAMVLDPAGDEAGRATSRFLGLLSDDLGRDMTKANIFAGLGQELFKRGSGSEE